MRLQSAHFQAKEVDAPPSPKYAIPSFKKPTPSQEPTIHDPQSTEEDKEETTKPKEEDPTLLFEDFPSFFEEEEEDKKVVPPLEEQVMVFQPFPVNEGLLLEEEGNHLLQQTTLYDVEGHTILVNPREVVHEQHEQDVEKNQEAPLPNQLRTTIVEHS